MKPIYIWCHCTCASLLFIAWICVPATVISQEPSAKEVVTSAAEALHDLGPLFAGKEGGIIYYATSSCQHSEPGEPVPFPHAVRQLDVSNRDVRKAISNLFPGTNTIKAAETDDFIKVIIGNLPHQNFLSTKIARIVFTGGAQKSALQALSAVTSSPDVSMAEREVGISKPITISTGSPYRPRAGPPPHFPI